MAANNKIDSPIAVYKRIVALKNFPATVAVLAADRLRRERSSDMLIDHFFNSVGLQAEERRSAITRVDSTTLGKEQIRSLQTDLTAINLFSNHRLFLIDNIDKLNAAATRSILDLVQSVPTGVFLILRGQSLSKKNPLLDYIQEQDCLILFVKPSPQELKRLIGKEFQRHQINNFPAGLADLLINVGQDLDTIADMIERLVLYSNGGTLSEEDFRKLFAELPNPNEFELIDSIVSKNLVKAELILYNLLNSGKNEFLLLSLLHRTYQQYFMIRSLLDQGTSPENIQSQLGLKDWLFRKQLAVAKKYPKPALETKLHQLLTADSKLKNRSLGADSIFGELIQKLAA